MTSNHTHTIRYGDGDQQHIYNSFDDQLSFDEVGGADTDSFHSSISVAGASVALSKLSISKGTREPIVVGYAFGPKKMKSMGLVMAEASRVKVIHEVPEEEEQEDEEEVKDDNRMRNEKSILGNSGMTEESALHHKRESSTLSSDALEELEQHDSVFYSNNVKKSPLGSTIITLGNSNESSDLRHIVRYFRSNCSSAADSLASMSQTSGSTTLISLNNNSSSGNHQKRKHGTKTRLPILISFVPLDPDQPLQEQHGGKFDLILHKLTEDILSCSLQQNSSCDVAASREEDPSWKRIQALQDYIQKNHQCCLVDNPRYVQTVMSRSDIAHVLQKCLKNVSSANGTPVSSPKFVVISNIEDPNEHAKNLKNVLKEEGISFPLIVKPLIAAGTKESHSMVVALQESAIVKLPPRTIVQEFVNHNATLYKVYVLGDFVSVYERHSLPNLPANLSKATVDLVEFDSQRPYPMLTDFGIETAEDDLLCRRSSGGKSAVTSEEVMPVVNALKKAFGLELFGFDILIQSTHKEWLVVDVNYFPSYKEVPNFPSLLARYLTRRVLEQRQKSANIDDTSSSETAHEYVEWRKASSRLGHCSPRMYAK